MSKKYKVPEYVIDSVEVDFDVIEEV